MLLSRKHLLKLSRFLAFQAFPIVIAGAFSLAQLNAGPVTWTASKANVNWANALNWSTGAAPVNGSDVIIGTGSTLASVDNISTANLSSLNSLLIDAPYTVTINSGRTLSIATLNLAGTLNVSGTVNVTAGGSLTGTIDNSGTLTLAGAFTGSGASINSGGTLTLDGSAVNTSIAGATLTGDFNSKGVVTLTSGTNFGVLTVTGAGTTTFAGGTNNGFLQSSTGPARILDIDGGMNMGAIYTNSGTVNITGFVFNNYAIVANGGALTIEGTVFNNSLSGTIAQWSGTVTLNDATIDLGGTSGTINATGTNTLTGVTNQGDINVTGAGTTTFRGGFNAGMLSSSTGPKRILAIDGSTNAGPLYNYGIIESGDGAVTMTGSIVNGSGGSIAQTGSGTVTLNSASVANGSFSGIIDATGTTSLNSLTNNGIVVADRGSTVSLIGAIANNGLLAVSDTATLQLTDGSSVTGGLIFNRGSGVVLSTGSVALNNTNVGGFDLTVTGGMLTTNNGINLSEGNTIRVESGATLNVSSGDIVNNGGTLHIFSGGTVDPPAGATYTQNSGTLRLGGTLDVSSAIFNGGTVTGQGGFSSDASVTNNGVTLYVAGQNHVGTWGFDDFDQTSGGTLVFDVGSTTTGDTMNLAGSATLGGTIVLNPLGGWTDNHPYDVLLITAADGITGTYAANLPYGLSLVLEPGTEGSESLYLQGQIPEPATIFLMLAGLCGAVVLVRRRKAQRG
jgi:fibronectin-binding autotransporter adhesin